MRKIKSFFFLLLGLVGLAYTANSLFGIDVISFGLFDSLGGFRVTGVSVAAISLFDTRSMLAAVEEWKTPRGFLTKLFFKTQNTFDTKFIDLDIFKGARKKASYVNPRAQGQVVERKGFKTLTVEPLYVKPKIPTVAQDLMQRLAGETIYSGGMTPQDRAAELLVKDLKTLDDMISRSEEYQASEALLNGKIVGLNGNEIDFERDAANTIVLAGGDLWSAGTSDPISDLRDWKRQILQKTGLSADTVIFAADVVAAFIKNTEVQKQLNVWFSRPGNIEPTDLGDGVTQIGYLNDPGVMIYAYDEWIEDSNGNEQPVIPAGKVLMGSSAARCSRNYGAIQDQNILAAVPRYPKAWVEGNDPETKWLQLHSSFIMLPENVDGFIKATVL